MDLNQGIDLVLEDFNEDNVTGKVAKQTPEKVIVFPKIVLNANSSKTYLDNKQSKVLTDTKLNQTEKCFDIDENKGSIKDLLSWRKSKKEDTVVQLSTKSSDNDLINSFNCDYKKKDTRLN